MIFTLKNDDQLPEKTVLKLYDIFDAINIKHYLQELFHHKEESNYVKSISKAIFKYCSSIDNDICFELKNFNETTIIPWKIKKYDNKYYILPYNSCMNNFKEHQSTLQRALNSL